MCAIGVTQKDTARTVTSTDRAVLPSIHTPDVIRLAVAEAGLRAFYIFPSRSRINRMMTMVPAMPLGQ